MIMQIRLSLFKRASMSEKRRDKRNRILREGEYQRTDGRYCFHYTDTNGKKKIVYSWRLDHNDATPKGKKRELLLCEKEKIIQLDLFERVVTNAGNYTVLELVEKYISLKTSVRANTKAGYKTVINIWCLDKNDRPMVALHWEKYLEHIVIKYNKIYRVQMSKVTPHVCRHIYCSNMAKSGMNPKTLQYLMGHSDISVTMNVYTHIGFDDAEEELKRMEEFRKAQAEVEQKKEKPMSQKMFKIIKYGKRMTLWFRFGLDSANK